MCWLSQALMTSSICMQLLKSCLKEDLSCFRDSEIQQDSAICSQAFKINPPLPYHCLWTGNFFFCSYMWLKGDYGWVTVCVTQRHRSTGLRCCEIHSWSYLSFNVTLKVSNQSCDLATLFNYSLPLSFKFPPSLYTAWRFDPWPSISLHKKLKQSRYTPWRRLGGEEV
jgi:hypothetical protein